MKYTSAIISAGSGSVGGCVFSRNASGPYIRNRSVPVNPSSTQQNVMRGALQTLVGRWSSLLTAAKRNGWDLWAFNTPSTDALGRTIHVTGQNAYISMNSLRVQLGLGTIDDAPSVFAGAPLTPPSVVSATAATQILSISFQNADPWATANTGALGIYVGRPQNPSRLFFAGPYRFGGKILGAVVPPTSPQPITSPFTFVLGQRIHVRFRAVQQDARISPDFRFSIIAV